MLCAVARFLPGSVDEVDAEEMEDEAADDVIRKRSVKVRLLVGLITRGIDR